jgi:hypothetical protein
LPRNAFRLSGNATHRTHTRSNTMAKGQLRSNREQKKPKQDKKPVAAPSSTRSGMSKLMAPPPAKK